MWDYIVNVYYGKEMTREEAENYKINDLDVIIHKINLHNVGQLEYIKGQKLEVDYKIFFKLRDDVNSFF